MFKPTYLLLLTAVMACALACHPVAENKASTEKTKDSLKVDSIALEELFDNLDKTTILKRLYDNAPIDTAGEVVWKPNYYERRNYQVSYDGKCHTAVDTIMYFIDSGNRQCAVAILANYKYEMAETIDSGKVYKAGCHFCGVPLGIALFAKTQDGKWQLYTFSKAFTTMGNFGQINGEIKLVKTGNSWTCLSLKVKPSGNSGEVNGYESLYSVEENHIGGFPGRTLQEVFFYYHTDIRDLFFNEHDSYEKESTIRFVEKPGTYSDIIQTTVEKGKKTTVTRYVFNDDTEVYEEVKK